MPFQIPSVRIAQASPSISLEKGSYRMRAPPSRSPSRPSRPARLNSAKSHSQNPDGDDDTASRSALGAVSEFVPASYEKRMALLVMLLTCAMLASFGTAWYLWTTSHPAHRLR
ncbi:hypothetical protein C8T65DRAFT_744652 [Cerioporus squamosus]|nr:hypothetical protein C8T65DRAFT_744652 [Cerioporus squamosus]